MIPDLSNVLPSHLYPKDVVLVFVVDCLISIELLHLLQHGIHCPLEQCTWKPHILCIIKQLCHNVPWPASLPLSKPLTMPPTPLCMTSNGPTNKAQLCTSCALTDPANHPNQHLDVTWHTLHPSTWPWVHTPHPHQAVMNWPTSTCPQNYDNQLTLHQSAGPFKNINPATLDRMLNLVWSYASTSHSTDPDHPTPDILPPCSPSCNCSCTRYQPDTFWQELNGIDNTISKSALTKQFKTMDGRSCNKSNDNDSETNGRKHQETPEGSWWLKIPLCCVPLWVYMVFQGQEHFHSC